MSIIEGVDGILTSLAGATPTASDVQATFDAVVLRLADRHRIAPRFQTRGPSLENWRLEKQLTISARNTSPEKTLEKKLAALLDPGWANMVPTASGLWDQHADKQRNLDLVHRVDDGVYEFVELKVGSDHPHSAALQLTTYMALFVVARRLYRGHRPRMLEAREVRLTVLAPEAFYRGARTRPLRDAFDEGLRGWARAKDPSLAVSFDFHAFPGDFRWPGEHSDQGLLTAFRARAPVA